MAEELAKYNCTMKALYSGCETMADNLEAKLAEMVLFKPKYTAAFVTAFRAKVALAKAMPDDQARGAAAETFGVDLRNNADSSMGKWQDLKLYINEIFPDKIQQKAQQEAAGLKHYGEIGNNNWEAVADMNTSAKNYLAANAVALSNGGMNMPGTFAASFTTASDAFDLIYGKFKVAEQTAVLTGQKVKANNIIYAEAIAIGLDGQGKYRTDPDTAKLFVWDSIQLLINPPGSSTLTPKVLLDETGAPAAGAKMILQKVDSNVQIALQMGDDGKIKSGALDPGRYKYLVDYPGRKQATGLKDVDAGTDARLEIRLVV